MLRILDIHIFDKSVNDAVKNIIQNIEENNRKNYCVSATSAHGLIIAQNNEQFRNVLDLFYMNLPDGMPVVWVGKLKGAKKMERCYGPDFFREVLITSKDKDINHYFCGGKDGVAEELKGVCEKYFINHNIVGTFSPPFREMTDGELKDLADQIEKSNADVVWIGMSTPKQELFAYRLSRYTKVYFICTVGAAFDFHTGRVIQAPKFIQKSGF